MFNYSSEKRASPPCAEHGTMMSYMSLQREDWGCMIQLFFDNASTLLAALAILFNMTVFGVPVDVINGERI